MSDQLNAAAKPLALEMHETGGEPENLKSRFDSLYGEGTYKINVHWGANIKGRWSAKAEMDFVTGYGDEIDIYLKREKLSP